MKNEIDFFRQEYATQKKMETFIVARHLVRPRIKKWQLVALYSMLATLLAINVCTLCVFRNNQIVKTLLFVALLTLMELGFKFCFIQTVKCYQHYASAKRRRRCLCIPSCSEYAILCLKLFPVVWALLKIKKTDKTT